MQLEGLLTRKELDEVNSDEVKTSTNDTDIILYGNGGKVIKAKTPNQRKMVELLKKNDVLFAIGPAGTGKTYTAVAMAVKALKDKEIKRIILARPAVEAGENLGFLPGDLKEKIDPYLRPLYDALDDMLPPEKLKLYIENRVIEIAPMAFMRGRTLDNAYVILDEAQNATDLQLKMFLTRMGPSAKFIITGDLTQIDLPKSQHSGLLKAVKILDNIKGITFAYLTFEDVVRHRLVKDIIKDLQRVLISSDVNITLVQQISNDIKKKALEEELPTGISRKEHLIKIIYDELVLILGGTSYAPRIEPHSILMVGLYGSGKTTTSGKLAKFYTKRGLKVCLISTDTWRPAAFEQLRQVGEAIKVPVFGNPSEKDALKIIKYADIINENDIKCYVLPVEIEITGGYDILLSKINNILKK